MTGRTRWPVRMRLPPSTRSVSAMRRVICTGESNRSSSSTAASARPGSRRSCSNWSRSRSKASVPLPIRLVVVSLPATSNSRSMASNLVLGQAIAGLLGGAQHGDEVVVPALLPPGDDAAKVVAEGDARPAPRGDDGGRTGRLQRAREVERPGLESALILGGHADHLRDHRDRERDGQRFDDVELRRAGEPVEEVFDDGRHPLT